MHLFLRQIAVFCTMTGTFFASAASFHPDTLRNRLPALETWTPVSARMLHEYHVLYGFDTATCRPVTGTFTSDSFTCTGQVFIPVAASGTVFFLHGYLDHTGTVVNGITACLGQRWAAASMDLPGHGLSSGERGAINDFFEYADAFGRFVGLCGTRVPRPWIFVGHSTGCAVGLEYLHTRPECPFEKVLLLAPLVRGDLYHLSRFANTLLSPFVRTVPRWFREASHDREFLRRFKDDPLQPRLFPLRWAKAYYAWHDRISGYAAWTSPIIVIQGTGDRVVEWHYNLPWLERHAEHLQIIRIEDARHQLLNESEPFRSACMDIIKRELNTVGKR